MCVYVFVCQVNLSASMVPEESEAFQASALYFPDFLAFEIFSYIGQKACAL